MFCVNPSFWCLCHAVWLTLIFFNKLFFGMTKNWDIILDAVLLLSCSSVLTSSFCALRESIIGSWKLWSLAGSSGITDFSDVSCVMKSKICNWNSLCSPQLFCWCYILNLNVHVLKSGYLWEDSVLLRDSALNGTALETDVPAACLCRVYLKCLNFKSESFTSEERKKSCEHEMSVFLV